MILVINILFLAGLSFWGYGFSKQSSLISFYWPGLVFKLIAGIAIGLIYTYYYPSGDTWTMMVEAIKLKDSAFSSFDQFWRIYFYNDYSSIINYSFPLQPRAAFMTKILAFLALVTGNNYWLVSLYLSLFSFGGFWFLANTILLHFNKKGVAVIPTLFFPSIVFWSAGVLKESVAMGSLALVFAITINIYFKRRVFWHEIILLIVGFYFLISLKYYYAAVLAVTVFTLFITRYIIPRERKWYIEAGYTTGIFMLIIVFASLSHPNFWPSRFLQVIVDNYHQYDLKSTTGNMVIFHDLQPTIVSFALHSPKALFTGLFSPLWMSDFSSLKLISLLENWLLLAAFIFSVTHFRLPTAYKKRLLLYVMILFIVTMAVFVTYSTPNYGTLVRYRIGYLVILVTMLTSVICSRIKSV